MDPMGSLVSAAVQPRGKLAFLLPLLGERVDPRDASDNEAFTIFFRETRGRRKKSAFFFFNPIGSMGLVYLPTFGCFLW